MFKKFLITSFILIANIPFVYSKDEPITFACLPPEGTMDAKEMVSYISSVEGAFFKEGLNVADRKRLERLIKEMESQEASDTDDETDATIKAGKAMKVDYLIGVTIDNWEEEKLDTYSMNRDRKKDVLKLKEEYILIYETVRINIRVIEVETSMVIAQGSAEDSSVKTRFRKMDTPDKLAKKVVNKVMKDVKKQLRKKK
ncbi:hypothetical protein [Brachyspira catarrhinii]|uniref:Penicillin-binding protein activator LpoB n=1 Tax=Brachyspira catarrhinii TaxID=2528966 RepID=A0ABY2TS57_9SPIR|nr:hypothetical protein [Brachyspira catarrhinii]TKZ35580.1 hypothetical protein EZH24_04525 [Brachyspira catarrhinii]